MACQFVSRLPSWRYNHTQARMPKQQRIGCTVPSHKGPSICVPECRLRAVVWRWWVNGRLDGIQSTTDSIMRAIYAVSGFCEAGCIAIVDSFAAILRCDSTSGLTSSELWDQLTSVCYTQEGTSLSLSCSLSHTQEGTSLSWLVMLIGSHFTMAKLNIIFNFPHVPVLRY